MVIMLGLVYDIFLDFYLELFGVSLYEFYYIWNVKVIWLIEMYFYDYQWENYFKFGYLCEGVMMYMGDLMLLKFGVFMLKDYFCEMKGQLQKYFDNFGWFIYLVVDFLFDIWLDGYVLGVLG